MTLPDGLHPATRAWFSQSFPAATAAQLGAWPPILRGDHTLLVAPTGSGKTLAAFLVGLDRLLHRDADTPPGVRILYLSPLKALVVDVERNLRAPLIGVQHAAARLGIPVAPVTVDVRTGDTPPRERARQSRRPGELLVTTPESLYLMLTSQAREALRTVELVILDEIHVLAGTKRGVHLALSMERLEALVGRPIQRVGLSATVRPLSVAASFLGGDRPVTVIDTSEPPRLDLEVNVPVVDMTKPPLPPPPTAPLGVAEGVFQYPTNQPRAGIWPSVHPEIVRLIEAHRSTIVFCNSRLLCERLTRALNEVAGRELVQAHHGSVSHERRAAIEEGLKSGDMPAIVATSSLELGIDMGAVDLVVLVESPGSVARGLQRVGRAGHQVGATSVGRIFPKHRGDLLEAAVVANHMKAGRIEETTPPRLCLDVLAQQIVAILCERPYTGDELLALARRAAPYRELSRELLDSVLDLLSGRYPSDTLAELIPTVVWDRATDTLTARRNARLTAMLNGGTIPDRGLYRVHLGVGGPRLGELDEEMVYETRIGDLLVLGASTWKVEDITRDVVIVSPAPGRPGRLPFWKGERPGRPAELGRAVGAFLRDLGRQPEEAAEAWVQAHTPLDALAARNLVAYVREQQQATGCLPTDRAITVERFRDELGDWRLTILTPFGSRLHAPWALAIEALMGRASGVVIQTMASDDGLSLRMADGESPPDLNLLLPDPDDLEELVIEQLRHSSMFAGRFRENAGRALLLPRRSATGRKPLWMQRKKSADLLAATQGHPSFPIVLETFRELLHDVFDLPGLTSLLRDVRSRKVRVDEVETKSASPFARSLVFQYVATWMYDGDSPLAERRAAALSLDRNLLAELLGQDALRDLLDADAIDEVERELSGLDPDRRVRHADGLADLLRRLGDLSEIEVAARVEGDAQQLVDVLVAARRAIPVRIAGELRVIAVEEAGRYRDGVGVALPPGLPAVFLGAVPDAMELLVRRWARTHGPFLTADLADRYGWPPAAVHAALTALVSQGVLVHGPLRPQGGPSAWCDADVLRRIKRRTLARLRREVEPVSAEQFASFLPVWQGVDGRRGGLTRLQEVLNQLEGLPVTASDLEDAVLPARIGDYQPILLDQLGATGEVVWVGRGALGPKDGQIALFRRSQADAWVQPATETPDGPVHQAILRHLQDRGAAFLAELIRASGASAQEATTCLWDLVWAGLITNDTLAPLRALTAGTPASRAAGGRWSLVADLTDEPAPPTRRALATATALLERYGIVAREHVDAERHVGGWSSVYPLLAALEDQGRIRRGWFVEGLGSAQFALPGAVDRLRATQPEAVARWIATTDPANAWGSILPWPDTTGKPRRVAGSRIGTFGGLPVLWLSASGTSVATFPASDDTTALSAVVGALARDQGYRTLSVGKVDGRPALEHPARSALIAAGFTSDHRGLLLTRHP